MIDFMRLVSPLFRAQRSNEPTRPSFRFTTRLAARKRPVQLHVVDDLESPGEEERDAHQPGAGDGGKKRNEPVDRER